MRPLHPERNPSVRGWPTWGSSGRLDQMRPRSTANGRTWFRSWMCLMARRTWKLNGRANSRQISLRKYCGPATMSDRSCLRLRHSKQLADGQRWVGYGPTHDARPASSRVRGVGQGSATSGRSPPSVRSLTPISGPEFRKEARPAENSSGIALQLLRNPSALSTRWTVGLSRTRSYQA